MYSRHFLISFSLFLWASFVGNGFGREEPNKAPRSEETVQKLVQQLGSEQYQERQKAKRLLVERDDALPELKKSLRSPDAEVRRLAKEAIKEIDARIKKRAADRVLAHIKRLLKNTIPFITYRGAEI